MRFPDYYGLLGLQPDHDPDELREAFLARWKENDGSLLGERIFLRHLGLSPRRRDLLREAYTVLTDPGLRLAYRLRTGLPAEWPTGRPDRGRGMACFREGCRRLVHKDYAAAYRYFRRAVERSPEEVNYKNYAVFALLAGGSGRDLARDHLRASLAQDPRRAETLLLLAWMQRRGGALRLARNSIRRSGELPVSDPPLFLRLRQVPELLPESSDGFWRRVVAETRSAFGRPIRLSTRS